MKMFWNGIILWAPLWTAFVMGADVARHQTKWALLQGACLIVNIWCQWILFGRTVQDA